MLFTSISPEAFDHKNIPKDIHEMNDHIKNLLVNAPPSHEIPFDVLQEICLLYTSPSPRDLRLSRMPSSA